MKQEELSKNERMTRKKMVADMRALQVERVDRMYAYEHISLLQEAKVKEINEIREKEKITAQLRAANHQQLLELQSNKKEKLDNLQTKVNVLYDNGCNKYNGTS